MMLKQSAYTKEKCIQQTHTTHDVVHRERCGVCTRACNVWNRALPFLYTLFFVNFLCCGAYVFFFIWVARIIKFKNSYIMLEQKTLFLNYIYVILILSICKILFMLFLWKKLIIKKWKFILFNSMLYNNVDKTADRNFTDRKYKMADFNFYCSHFQIFFILLELKLLAKQQVFSSLPF